MSLQDRLEGFYRRTDEDFLISDFIPISDGWETEVYSFAVTLRRQTERMILRMYPGVDAAEKSSREFQGLTVLKGSSRYPVPSVFFHETDPAWLGKPFIIMQRIDGQSLGWHMRDNRARFGEYISRFAQLFVDLHLLDHDPFLWLSPVMLQDDPAAFVRHKLADGRRVIVDQMRQTWAVRVLDWLNAHMADIHTERLSVLHNDFHPYNILLTPDDAAYVIDWGNIEVGDYRYDLAWTLLLSATHGSQQERDHVLSEYERLSGHPVEQIEYFEVIAALRRLIGFAVSLSSGAETAGMRPEAAGIMRQQAEHFRRVYAVLQQHSGLRLPEIERLLNSL